MAFQPVPDTAQVEIRMTLYGQQVENVVHFKATGLSGQDELDALADAVAEWYGDTYVNVLANDVVGREIYARMLDNAIDIQSIDTTIGSVPGGAGTPAAPGNVTFCVTLRSGLTGRSARGRMFIPGIPESVITGNAVSGTYANSCLTAVNQLATAALAAGWQMVVVSRQQNGVVLPTGLTYAMVGAGYADLNTDSQRRRLNARGV